MKASDNRACTERRAGFSLFAAAAALVVLLALAVGAPAQDLQSELDQKRAELDHAKAREGVLSTTIERYDDRLNQLRGEVATLRNREAIVAAQLKRKQAELDRAKSRLVVLRARLKRSLNALRERLVAIYESNQPDTVTVILNSDGFDEMVSRYEYLQRIQSQDNAIADRVRTLRDETRDMVERVRAARDEIAAQRDELAQTRIELESRQADLAAVREDSQGALAGVQQTQDQLEGDIGDLEGQIQAQLQAQAAQASEPALPAGPVQGESSAGFIWPVNGPVVSGFGMRWGRMHTGIDIAVPAGVGIRAAAAGTVAIAGPNAGYGNFTCIGHAGGVSTCYAHQSSIGVSVGQSVGQGDVIGAVGCTGHCFGDHLHFEVRVNGSAVDPLGYL